MEHSYLAGTLKNKEEENNGLFWFSMPFHVLEEGPDRWRFLKLDW